MKKRWLSLYVENDVGVLAKVSGLFSGKSYNLESLTVGTTEDPTVSRMTIGLKSDDNTFDQIKKQLNRCVEVIKVIDLTNIAVCMRELLFIRVDHCSKDDMTEIYRIVDVYGATVLDYGINSILIQSVQTEMKNNDLIKLMKELFKNIKVVRGGDVAIESINITDILQS